MDPEKGMKRALALIAYEDIFEGGGFFFHSELHPFHPFFFSFCFFFFTLLL